MIDESNNIKGIKIKKLLIIGSIAAIILLVFAGYNLSLLVNNYKSIVKDFSVHFDLDDNISSLQEGSDDMTEQSRLFVVNKDPEHMSEYFEIVDDNIRENAISNVEQYFIMTKNVKSIDKLRKALSKSNALMDYEVHSMKLMVLSLDLDESVIPEKVKKYTLPEIEMKLSDKEKQEYASQLVFGMQYRILKEHIDEDIASAINTISKETNLNISKGVDNMWIVIVCIILSYLIFLSLLIVVFLLVLILVIHPIYTFINCIQHNHKLSVVGAYEIKYLAQTYNLIYEINNKNKAQMKYELKHDALTDAYSRLAFEKLKKKLIKYKLPIALLIIDVDKFKSINDNYGHDSGDISLIKVVDTLKKHLVRKNDIIARVGGDEFIVILINTSPSNQAQIGEKIDKINNILENPEDHLPAFSLSVGIAFSETGYNDELYVNADKALYQAKKADDCGYSVYNE